MSGFFSSVVSADPADEEEEEEELAPAEEVAMTKESHLRREEKEKRGKRGTVVLKNFRNGDFYLNVSSSVLRLRCL